MRLIKITCSEGGSIADGAAFPDLGTNSVQKYVKSGTATVPPGAAFPEKTKSTKAKSPRKRAKKEPTPASRDKSPSSSNNFIFNECAANCAKCPLKGQTVVEAWGTGENGVMIVGEAGVSKKSVCCVEVEEGRSAAVPSGV